MGNFKVNGKSDFLMHDQIKGSVIYWAGYHFCTVVLIIWVAIGLILVRVIIYVVQPVWLLVTILGFMVYFSRWLQDSELLKRSSVSDIS